MSYIFVVMKYLLMLPSLFMFSGEDKIVVTPPFPESVAEGDIRWEKGMSFSMLIRKIMYLEH